MDNAEDDRCVIMLVVLRIFLGGFWLFHKSKAHENSVKRAGIPCTSLIFSEFTVKLANRNVGVSSMVILNPFEFFFRVSVWVR